MIELKKEPSGNMTQFKRYFTKIPKHNIYEYIIKKKDLKSNNKKKVYLLIPSIKEELT